MNKELIRINECVMQIKEKIDFVPKMAIVLGSGLGGYTKNIDVVAELPYSEIEGFPVSTVQGHDGRFLFGYVNEFPVIAMKGRIHFYEGYDIEEVVLPIRVMGCLGAKYILLTNAAGGIDLDFTAGDLMAISDHISSFVRSPLIGENLDYLGIRFPDMSRVYDTELLNCIRRAADSEGFGIKEGVYLQTTGPQFETPAEIKMFRNLGASAVGMSTVVEAIAAHHMGMRVCGISCISNMAAGISNQPLSHGEVQETADRVAHRFESLVSGLVKEVAKID